MDVVNSRYQLFLHSGTNAYTSSNDDVVTCTGWDDACHHFLTNGYGIVDGEPFAIAILNKFGGTIGFKTFVAKADGLIAVPNP